MIHSIVYNDKNNILRNEILLIGKNNSHCMVKLWNIFDSIVELENRIKLSETVTKEEFFTIKSIKEYSDKECNLEILAVNTRKAEEREFYVSLTDILYFKGLVLASHFHTSSSDEKRGILLEETKQILKLNNIWGTNKGYDNLIEGMIQYFYNEKETAIKYLKEADKRVFTEDHFAKEIIKRHLMYSYLYLKQYSKSIQVISKRINDNVNFNDWSDFHINLLHYSGSFGKIIEVSEQYYKMIPNTEDIGDRWNKLFFLYYLLKMALLLNDESITTKYSEELVKLSDLFVPEARYTIPHTAVFSLEMSQCYLHNNIEIENVFHSAFYSKTEEDSLYIRYFKAKELLPTLIEFYIDNSNFEKALHYIKLLLESKGKGHQHNNVLDFYYHYYLSIIISKTIKWKEYNLIQLKGNQLEVASKYLHLISPFKESLPIAMQLLFLIQNTKLNMLQGYSKSIDIQEIKSFSYLQGFWKLQLMGVLVLYYIIENERENYNQYRTILINELSKYEKYPIYQRWKTKLFRVLDDREKFDNVSELISHKRKQHIEEIVSNLEFIQKETQTALKSK